MGWNVNFLKILLVDDEEEVRKIIAKKVPWEKLGYELIGNVSNGQEAMEVIEVNEPDVVLTDIRMPFMDGLELASKLKDEYPDIKVIIFSGFDEFEYAKQALKYNVIEYILKPVNIEEMTEILRRVRQSIVEDLLKKRNIEKLKEAYMKGLPVIKERFLTDLVHGKLKSREEIQQKMSLYQIPLMFQDQYLVATLMLTEKKTDNNREFEGIDQEEMQYFSVKQYLEEMVQDQYKNIFMRTTSGWSVILGLKKGETGRKAVMLFNNFCRSCKKLLDIEITVGVEAWWKT